MHSLAAILLILVASSGCASSQRRFYGGGVYQVPGVAKIGSVTLSDESPGIGFPLLLMTPIYPMEMNRAGIAGSTLVRVRVDETGEIRDLRILQSTQREFERTTLLAAAAWRFFEMPDLLTKKRKGLLVDCVVNFTRDED